MTEQSRPKPIELVARAIYEVAPNSTVLWTKGADGSPSITGRQVRSWDEATEAHEACRAKARAAFDILIKHGCISIEGIIARDEELACIASYANATPAPTLQSKHQEPE